MLVERTAQIVIDWDDDLAETLKVFTDIQNEISPSALMVVNLSPLSLCIRKFIIVQK